MPVINILPPHVADMIAAGEVVERPASVIKELMENSFDAGARNISVEIRGGGSAYIRVSDDGCGMSPEDAGIAFTRHATSKLHDERGLEAIGTMGFRGEALAAIAAVSEIELLTCKKNQREGTRLTLLAGEIQQMHAAGCPEGSTITIKRLFFNTPARLKFLKSDRSEASACALATLRCALSRPDVSVRFIRDGKEEFFSPGDGRQDSCLYTLLGRDVALSMLECASQRDGMKISGFVSSPRAGRGNRSQQYFFCNGRYIRSALLQAALEQAYKNTLLTGKYPSCVLYLDIGLGSVDVNVHPTKMEVKFSEEKKVFDLVYYAVLSALQNEEHSGTASVPAPKSSVQPKADFYRSMSSESFRANNYSVKSAPTKSSAPAPAPIASRPVSPAPSVFKSPSVSYQTKMELPRSSFSAEKAGLPRSSAPVDKAPAAPIVEKPVQNVESSTVPDHKIVGEALKTYIIVELDEELILIDKHAAHERMIFDRLKEEQREIMTQTLLEPVTLRLSGEDAEVLEANSQLLIKLGFEIDAFGETEYIVRAVPADMAPADVPSAIEEVCEKLRRGRQSRLEQMRDDILHTVACKAAIKAGWDTHEKELERLVEAVLSGRVKYCPHGRPVSIRLSRQELDKQFKRIV